MQIKEVIMKIGGTFKMTFGVECITFVPLQAINQIQLNSIYTYFKEHLTFLVKNLKESEADLFFC